MDKNIKKLGFVILLLGSLIFLFNLELVEAQGTYSCKNLIVVQDPSLCAFINNNCAEGYEPGQCDYQLNDDTGGREDGNRPPSGFAVGITGLAIGDRYLCQGGGGVCIKSAPVQECNPGIDVLCSANENNLRGYKICQSDGAWSNWSRCGGSEVCNSDAEDTSQVCIESECTKKGQLQCGENNQRYRECQNDLSWGDWVKCGAGNVCNPEAKKTENICIPRTCPEGWYRCEPGSDRVYQQCGDFDNDGLIEWDFRNSCKSAGLGDKCITPNATSKIGNVCDGGIVEECSPEKWKECIDNHNFRRCGDDAGIGINHWEIFACEGDFGPRCIGEPGFSIPCEPLNGDGGECVAGTTCEIDGCPGYCTNEEICADFPDDGCSGGPGTCDSGASCVTNEGCAGVVQCSESGANCVDVPGDNCPLIPDGEPSECSLECGSGNQAGGFCCAVGEFVLPPGNTCQSVNEECRLIDEDPNCLTSNLRLSDEMCSTTLESGEEFELLASSLYFFGGFCTQEMTLTYNIQGVSCALANFEESLQIAKFDCGIWQRLDTQIFSNGDKTGRAITGLDGPGTYAVVLPESCVGVPQCDNDGILDFGEECDGSNLGGKTCNDLGFTGGSLSCSGCRLDASQCEGANLCGNGVIDPGETCEGNNLVSLSCSNFDDFTGGVLSCNSECQIDTSQCTGGTDGFCGDGDVNIGEECDGNDLNELTCLDFGFLSGGLSCNSDCTLDTKSCGNVVCADGETRQCGGIDDLSCSYFETCVNGQFDGQCVKDEDSCGQPCVSGDVIACPNQLGVCQDSFQVCNDNGEWPGCDYGSFTDDYSTTDICSDFLDNNCDGNIDEQCNCVPGDTLNCGSSVGQCSFGVQVCGDDGIWGSCEGGVLPNKEACDGIDNDCDGSRDETCPCGSFGEGFKRTCGTLECGQGFQTCSENSEGGIEWGSCEGGSYPQIEICDAVDNDCDGLVDESCPCELGTTRTCGSDTGQCSVGVQRCEDTGLGFGNWGTCQGDVGPGEEACDGIDNNCDGTVDEGCPCLDENGNETNSRLCPTQEGVCKNLIQLCEDGVWADCDFDSISDHEETEVSCEDGLDNDCDGLNDTFDLSCVSSSVLCSDGTPHNSCTANQPGFCNSGSIENKCVVCGCPGDQVCQTNGDCKPRGIIILPKCGDSVCSATESCSTCSADCGPCNIGTEFKDSDGDGLSDDDEVGIYSTDPFNTDTDGDGINDGDEIAAGTDPLNPDDYPDKDSKGFPWIIVIIIIALILILVFGIYYYFGGKAKGKDKKKSVYLVNKNPRYVTLSKQVGTPFIQEKKELKQHSNINQLNEFILLSLERGKSENEVKNSSMKSGWTKEEVDNAIRQAKKRLERGKVKARLYEYVGLSFDRGLKEGQIRAKLLAAGWKIGEINNAINKAKSIFESKSLAKKILTEKSKLKPKKQVKKNVKKKGVKRKQKKK